MAKVHGPLFGQEASGLFGKSLDFTKDGNVRQERHRAPRRSSGVAQSRAIMQAINGTSLRIGNGRRQELQALSTNNENWASLIATQAIGSARANWLTDDVLWDLLSGPDQTDWHDAATTMRIRDASIADVDQVSHEVTRGEALFHVACAVYRCSLPTSPTQPTGNNATAWSNYLTEGWPPLPVNALVLNNEPLLLGAELLTL